MVVYRTDAGGSVFKRLGTAATGSSYTDTGTAGGATLDASTLNGNYSYMITYYKAGEQRRDLHN